MSIVDYGGNGTCGPRCYLKTHDDTQARSFYQKVEQYALTHKEQILETIIQKANSEVVGIMVDALLDQNDDHIKLLLGEKDSSSDFFMIVASIMNGNGVIISRDQAQCFKMEGPNMRNFSQSNYRHWVEII